MAPSKPGMVVVQLHSFDRAAKGLLSEERVQEIIGELALRPEAGDLIEGTGGVRKVRFGVDGRGKRGGVRVVYLFRDTTMPLFLITVFAKKDIPNLTKAQQNAMGSLVDGIVTDWQARLLPPAR